MPVDHRMYSVGLVGRGEKHIMGLEGVYSEIAELTGADYEEKPKNLEGIFVARLNDDFSKMYDINPEDLF